MKTLSTGKLWIGSALLSLVAVALMALQWTSIEQAVPEGSRILVDDADLRAALTEAAAAKATVQFQEDAPPVEVPTGFFIQSVAFVSPSDVNVTGYAWQKYPRAFAAAGLQQGLAFPEEVNASQTTLREHYRTEVTHDGQPHELVGWFFEVTVREVFDYSNYPLDDLTIWLRVWPRDFDNADRIVLVPDFDSYFRPGRARLGLDREIVQGEWDIERSFYSFREIPYDTAFGYDSYETAPAPELERYTELYFNLGAKRRFIDVFVINLVPLFVVALLVFGALMMTSADKRQSERFGFSTFGILGTCSGLFFVVLLSHIQVRGQVAGSGLVYIEYFYLVMYLTLLLTALNVYVFTLEGTRRDTILHHRDNIIAKVAFWPLLLWTMVAIGWAVL